MNTNLSAEENFRIHGKLPADQIEELLDLALVADKVDDAKHYMQEVKSGFPEEDFLHAELAEMNEFVKAMRGQNKANFKDLIGRIEERRNEQNQAAEHGADQLKQALKALN
ncbi:hypothetical protein LP414_27535 [Polaromonas sp. P1(28)-13]|nr:hypothetical protein LP414_27535 [Polaromonas sp. P1(28)-13]